MRGALEGIRYEFSVVLSQMESCMAHLGFLASNYDMYKILPNKKSVKDLVPKDYTVGCLNIHT